MTHSIKRIKEFSEAEDSLSEIISQRITNKKNEKGSRLCELWNTIKRNNLCIIGVTGGEERRKGSESLF